MSTAADILKGSLDLLVLKTLSLAPMHGWGISQRVQQISDGVLEVNQGSLYPALQRLEKEGLITSDWGTTDNNRRARYYRLTASGSAPGRGARELAPLRRRHGPRAPRGGMRHGRQRRSDVDSRAAAPVARLYRDGDAVPHRPGNRGERALGAVRRRGPARRPAGVRGVDRAREDYRDAFGTRVLDDGVQHVRHAVRSALRVPTFTATAVTLSNTSSAAASRCGDVCMGL